MKVWRGGLARLIRPNTISIWKASTSPSTRSIRRRFSASLRLMINSPGQPLGGCLIDVDDRQRRPQRLFQTSSRQVSNGADDLVIARSKYREHRLTVANHTLLIDNDDRALRPAQHRLHTEKLCHFAALIRQQALRQIVMLGEFPVRFNRGNRNRDDFRTGCLIVSPAITHAAHLLRADRGFVSGIKDQRDNLASML